MRKPADISSAAAVAGAALLWASSGIAAAAAPPGATGAALALCRLVPGGLALAALLGPRRAIAVAARLPRGPLLAASAAMALFQWSFFAAVPGAGAGACTLVCAATGPWFSGLLAGRRRRLAGLCCILLALATLAAGGARPSALLLALASGAAYAGYAQAAARLAADSPGCAEHSLAATAIALLAAGIPLAPFAMQGLAPLANLRGAALAAWLALATTALAYRLFVPALLRLGSGRSLALLCIEPPAAILAAALALHEPLSAFQLAALGLLSAAAYPITHHRKDQEP